MSEYSGYIFIIDEARRALAMEDYIHGRGTFTDTISAPDWRAKDAEIFLISLDGEAIHHAALVHRGRRVATQKYQIRFSNFVGFEPVIPFDQIHELLPSQSKRYFIRSPSGTGSRLPPKTWRNLIITIKQLRPGSAQELDQLEQLVRLTPGFFNRPGVEIMAQERDAINSILRMSGFDHMEILNWRAPTDQIAPFLQGLQKVTVKEDQIIAHDAEIFGDWKRIERYQVGATIFEKGRQRLTMALIYATKPFMVINSFQHIPMIISCDMGKNLPYGCLVSWSRTSGSSLVLTNSRGPMACITAGGRIRQTALTELA